jgi:hypothetical protein
VLAFLASLLEGGDPEEIEAGAEAFPDPLGLAYFYSLASSLLMGGQPEKSHEPKD